MLFTKAEALIIGVVLAVLQGLQISTLDVSMKAHVFIGVGIQVLGGLGVSAAKPAALRALVPVHVATIITLVVAGLQYINLVTLDIGDVVKGVIGGLLVLASVFGFSPVAVKASADVDSNLGSQRGVGVRR